MQETENKSLLTDLNAEESATVNGGHRHHCRYSSYYNQGSYGYNSGYGYNNTNYYGGGQDYHYARYPYRRSYYNISVSYNY
jgi:hypothetical protein